MTDGATRSNPYVLEDSEDYLGTSKVSHGAIESSTEDVAEAVGIVDEEQVVAIESEEGVVVLPESADVDPEAVLGTYQARRTHAALRFKLGRPVVRSIGVDEGDYVRFYDRDSGVLVTEGGGS